MDESDEFLQMLDESTKEFDKKLKINTSKAKEDDQKPKESQTPDESKQEENAPPAFDPTKIDEHFK